MKKYGAGRGCGLGGGSLKVKHYIFVCVCGSFLQSSGQLAFVKMYTFLQVMDAVCSNGICWNEKKKFLFLEEGSPEKKMSYVSAWWWC